VRGLSQRRATLSRSELQNIIELCQTVERKGLNPFEVDVKSLLAKLRRMLEKAKHVEDIVMDAETLYRIALLIAFQGRWLRQKASSLFIDHQLVAVKLAVADDNSLAQVFLRSWRPIVRLEQLTAYKARLGMEHFLNLPSIDRKRIGLPSPTEISMSEIEEMTRAGLLEEVWFEEKLKQVYAELLDQVGRGKVDYWRFVLGKDFLETLAKAYAVSFLVTNGKVDLKSDPLTDEKTLVVLDEKAEGEDTRSVAVAMNEETLREKKREREQGKNGGDS